MSRGRGMPGWWKPAFLECLRQDPTGCEKRCAERAGVSDRAVRYAKGDPEFLAEVESAHRERTREHVEQSLRSQRRAASAWR